MRRYRDEEHRRFVRNLRQSMTPAERTLWYHLRAHRFRGHSIRRQFPIGRFVVDFYCPRARLVIEVDGETHDPASDARRDIELAVLGFRVVRFTNRDVRENLEGVLCAIAETLAS